jgi:hypothetical protein
MRTGKGRPMCTNKTGLSFIFLLYTPIFFLLTSIGVCDEARFPPNKIGWSTIEKSDTDDTVGSYQRDVTLDPISGREGYYSLSGLPDTVKDKFQPEIEDLKYEFAKLLNDVVEQCRETCRHWELTAEPVRISMVVKPFDEYDKNGNLTGRRVQRASHIEVKGCLPAGAEPALPKSCSYDTKKRFITYGRMKVVLALCMAELADYVPSNKTISESKLKKTHNLR